MAKCDYTIANIKNISNEITAMKNVTDLELSIESMQYDWYNTIFTLAEIQMVCNEKNRLSKFFEQAEERLSKRQDEIIKCDEHYSNDIAKVTDKVVVAIGKIDVLNYYLKDTIPDFK